jgi:hypothetical protein
MSDTRMSKTVYVVEIRECCDRAIGGVYASPEAAMAAYPVDDNRARVIGERHGHVVGWHADGESWYNGLNGDDSASIHAYEVKG